MQRGARAPAPGPHCPTRPTRAAAHPPAHAPVPAPTPGALIAAATDLSFNPRGYAAVLCNDLLTSLYLIMVKNTPGTNGLRWAGWGLCGDGVGRAGQSWADVRVGATGATIGTCTPHRLCPPPAHPPTPPRPRPHVQHHRHAVLQLGAQPAHAAGGHGGQGGALPHDLLPAAVGHQLPDGALPGLGGARGACAGVGWCSPAAVNTHAGRLLTRLLACQPCQPASPASPPLPLSTPPCSSA